MNESTLTQFKIIVEQAVRPVRASTARKRTIREELLAHVIDVYDGELTKIGDEQAALKRTALRFGKPGELTSQLQETVPASDVIRRFWEGQIEESTLRTALRLAWVAGTLAVVILIAASIAGASVTHWPREAFVLCSYSILSLSLYLFSLAFLSAWMRPSLIRSAGRYWLTIALIAVEWLLLSLFVFVGLPMLNGALPTNSDRWAAIAMASWLGNPLVPYCLAYSAVIRIRDHREWAMLSID